LREAKRLLDAIQAAEKYKARRGIVIDEALRSSTGIARYRAYWKGDPPAADRRTTGQ
jgi:hypothetical protein